MNSTAGMCCICLTEYGENEIPFELSCGHQIHSECMLRLCLNDMSSVRCPYCRASLNNENSASEDSNDSDADTEIVEVVAPPMPQWMRLRWQPLATGRSMQIQECVVKKLLSRASSKRAPDVLKRCYIEQKQLKKNLESARARVKQCKRGKSCRTVRETLQLLKKIENLVLIAERRLRAHMKAVLTRCQRSQNVVNYFWLYPISDAQGPIQRGV